MKKLISTLLIIAGLSYSVFADEEIKTEETAASSASENRSLHMKAGGFFNYEPSIGELSDFIAGNLGGGAAYEFSLPLPVMNWDFGGVVRIAANGSIIKDDNLDSMFNLKFYAGGFINIPLGNTGLSVVPEIDYGMSLYFPKTSSNYTGDNIKSCYADQMLQIGLGCRYSHPKMLNGNLEYELAVSYILGPEQEDATHLIGLRLGVLYKFM